MVFLQHRWHYGCVPPIWPGAFGSQVATVLFAAPPKAMELTVDVPFLDAGLFLFQPFSYRFLSGGTDQNSGDIANLPQLINFWSIAGGAGTEQRVPGALPVQTSRLGSVARLPAGALQAAAVSQAQSLNFYLLFP